jgi:phosphomevalonate kinase
MFATRAHPENTISFGNN